MEYKDYYATLGVSREASADDIQKAYRKLARKYHPDVNRDPGAEQRFKEINESYEVLKDSEKRSTYDRFGKNWKSYQKGGAPPPGFEGFSFDFGGDGANGFSSFFDMLFNQGQAGPGGQSRGGFHGGFGGGAAGFRGRDQEVRIVLSLEEAAQGGKRDIGFRDPLTGQNKTFTVQLPAGVRDGQKIRLAGRGSPGAGGSPPGDLFLKVELRAHDRFKIRDRDLHMDLPITPWDAALGTDATVRTLDGTVKVKIPQGTSTGRKIRLKGRGFPNPQGTAGDLYAEVKIVVPEELTRKERELFESLAKVSKFKPK